MTFSQNKMTFIFSFKSIFAESFLNKFPLPKLFLYQNFLPSHYKRQFSLISLFLSHLASKSLHYQLMPKTAPYQFNFWVIIVNMLDVLQLYWNPAMIFIYCMMTSWHDYSSHRFQVLICWKFF